LRPVLHVQHPPTSEGSTFGRLLGVSFHEATTGLQFAGDVDKTSLDEVRNELAFSDLTPVTAPACVCATDSRRPFRSTPPESPRHGAKTVDNTDLVKMIHELRYAKGYARIPLLRDFRELVKDAGHQGF
ncbi:hypothetical protein AB0F91_46950, partial [Amycolatopsis sp. NPDC023774]|uniref:hypothetical protein n=1 Tax=Amycolatopsis sp. NPDC023774 TaxID=3155015 RepID=UPI00340BEB5F